MKQVLILFLGILFSIEFFSFLIIPNAVFDIGNVLFIGIFLLGALNRKNFTYTIGKKFRIEVLLIVAFVLLSSIPAALYHHQPIYISILASRSILYWFIYFFLHNTRPDPAKVEKICLAVGVLWCLITIVQQFTYPTVYFNDVSDKEGFLDYYAETRGVIRITVAGFWFAFFLGLTSINKLVDRFNYRYLLIFFIVAIAIFYTGSRQYIASLLLISMLLLFFNKSSGGGRTVPIFAMSISVILFVYLKYDYILTLISVSEQDFVSGDSYIRILAMRFYLLEYWPGWLSFFLGNGWEHTYSSYGTEIHRIWDFQHYFREDVGIIGALNKFGLFYLVVVTRILYKAIFSLKLPSERQYLRYFFILLFLLYWAAQDWFSSQQVVPLLAVSLYLVDVYTGVDVKEVKQKFLLSGQKQ